ATPTVLPPLEALGYYAQSRRLMQDLFIGLFACAGNVKPKMMDRCRITPCLCAPCEEQNVQMLITWER
ncbi:MAG: hypothetical protein IKG22_08545, partial [Atopobiaceae bacterium]|nr:hypothetical protein [Atopobiaceae bacterium]